MFSEGNGQGGEPVSCTACKQPIWGAFTVLVGHDCDGTYHPGCAKPLASLMRALDALGRVGQ